MQCRRQGRGNRGSLPRAPSVRGAPNSAGLVRIRCVRQSHSSLAFQGLVSLYFRMKSASSFDLCFMLLTQIMHNYLTLLLHSPLARAPYMVLFNLKPLIEDGNLQVYVYCVHARKRASGAPRTHFRACKISKFPGSVPPDHPHTIHFVRPHILYLPWAPHANLLSVPAFMVCVVALIGLHAHCKKNNNIG